MHDIKIPDGGEEVQGAQSQGTGGDDDAMSELEPRAAHQEDVSSKVKVDFEKFIQLIATHNFEEVMKRYPDEDVIISTNLLADLANAHEEKEESGKKLPMIFLVGVILGILITYFLIQY